MLRKGVSQRLTNLAEMIQRTPRGQAAAAKTTNARNAGGESSEARRADAHRAELRRDVAESRRDLLVPAPVANDEDVGSARKPPPPTPAMQEMQTVHESTKARSTISPLGAVVDIFRNGKPPKAVRATMDGSKVSANERTSFEDKDFETFNKLPPEKRTRLYFVADLKQHISPESSVVDYLGRIDLIKVDKLLALTKVLSAAGSNSNRRSSEPSGEENETRGSKRRSVPVERSRKKNRGLEDTAGSGDADAEDGRECVLDGGRPLVAKKGLTDSAPKIGSVFSFGAGSPTLPGGGGGGVVIHGTPMPFSRGTLVFDFASSRVSNRSSTENVEATAAALKPDGSVHGPPEMDEEEEEEEEEPPRPELVLEPGLLDFLAGVRDMCASYSKVRRLWWREHTHAAAIMVAPTRSVVGEGLPRTLSIGGMVQRLDWHPNGLNSLGRCRVVLAVLQEMSHKLDSALTDFSALQPKRASQLEQISLAHRFVERAFSIHYANHVKNWAEQDFASHAAKRGDRLLAQTLASGQDLRIPSREAGGGDSPPEGAHRKSFLENVADDEPALPLAEAVVDALVSSSQTLRRQAATRTTLAITLPTTLATTTTTAATAPVAKASTTTPGEQPVIRRIISLLAEARRLKKSNFDLAQVLVQDHESFVSSPELWLAKTNDILRTVMDRQNSDGWANTRHQALRDDDGVDVFLRNTQLDIRNCYVSRVGDAKQVRRQQTKSSLILEEGADCCNDSSVSVRKPLPPALAALVFGGGQENRVVFNIFPGATLSNCQAKPAPFDVDQWTTNDPVLSAGSPEKPQEWWLDQIKRVPVTPIRKWQTATPVRAKRNSIGVIPA